MLLPAPFAPIYPTISPSFISNEMLSTALTSENFLERKPIRADIAFSQKEGIVTLEIENKGIFNRI